MDTFSLLILFMLVASVLQPALQARMLASKRAQQIRTVERERGSRVITMIHREETRKFFAVPVARMISLEDAQQIIPAIQETPNDTPIDLVVHTPGGMVLAAMQIARALKAHPAKVTVHVPVYAMSGGTLIALAADEIAMDDFSVLGPIDPQIAGIPAASLLAVKAEKPIEEINDLTLMFANMSEKALRQVKAGARELLNDKMAPAAAEALVEKLASGQWTHDYALTFKEARQLGLHVKQGVPGSIRKLMRLYPQPVRQQPAIEFLPLPTRAPSREAKPAP